MSSSSRSARRRSRGVCTTALAALVALSASGCVSLQSSGPITKVQEGDEGGSQEQIWPSPPSAREGASEIVAGFLEAARSGASNQHIAADYLTSAIQGQWRDDQNTVIVLADYTEGAPQSAAAGAGSQDSSASPDPQDGAEVPPGTGEDAGGDADSAGDDGSTDIQVAGTVIGKLDAQGLYSAMSGSATFQFTVEQTKAGYRIAQLPPDFGVLMERSDFESSYSRHTVYYENPQRPGYYVPAGVYLPATDPDSEVAWQLARLIVSPVPTQLAPALQDPVTHATFVKMVVDGSGNATVTIKSNGDCVKSQNPCVELAQQLAQSLGTLSAKVASVDVVDETSGQTTLAYTPKSYLYGYGLDDQGHPSQSEFYAVSQAGELERVDTAGGVLQPDVPLGANASKLHFSQVAVAPGGGPGSLSDHVALLGQDGDSVYVAHPQGAGEALDQIFPAAGIQAGGKVGRLAWDSDENGALWFTYVLDGTTNVYRYYEGQLTPVTVIGLGVGDLIQSVVPAPDGDRVAVGYTDTNNEASIVITAAVPQASGGYEVDLADSEAAAASWNDVVQFDWYNEDSIAVLGTPPSSQDLGLYQLYADGSPVYDTLTQEPVQASPPSQADSFVWNAGGQPIASVSQDQDTLYTLSVEGQEAQPLGTSRVSGVYPGY
jgi:hypothetical protein